MNGAVHVRQIADVVLHAGKFLGVLQKALHLRLGAAVAQLEVVQHGVVAFGKPLIGVLDGLHVGAHLVGVVRHVGEGSVGRLGRCGGIAGQTGHQRRRKAGGLLHIVVGRQPCRAESVLGVGLDGVGGIAIQRLHAAEGLFQRRALLHGVQQDLAQPRRGQRLFGTADQLLRPAFTGGLPGAGGFAAKGLGDLAGNALCRGNDLHIGFTQFRCRGHALPPSKFVPVPQRNPLRCQRSSAGLPVRCRR